MRRYFLLLSLLCSHAAFATELAPWLGKDFEIEGRTDYLYQTYNRVKGGHHHYHSKANDFFYHLSASASALDYSLEVETTIAQTKKQRPGCDEIKITGRYRLWDDISAEAPFTVTPGISLTQAFDHSLKDISSFHHGMAEGELTLALGKEVPCEAFWFARCWAVAGIGCGDHGSPWVRGDFYYERNWWDRQQLRWFVKTLWGLGHEDLNCIKHFDGYGSIRHQSIDLGVRYTYLLDFGLTFGLQYVRRVYARNFPEQVNVVKVDLFYPFGL